MTGLGVDFLREKASFSDRRLQPVSWSLKALATAVAIVPVMLQTASQAEVLSVTGGLDTTTVGPRTYESVLVTGTAADGHPSTYTASGFLTLTDPAAAMTAADSGRVIIDGGLSAVGYGDISGGGSLTANSAASFDAGFYAYDGGSLAIGGSGSLSTPVGQLLYLSGITSFTRSTGGSYSVGVLSIADSATVGFTSSDAVAGDVLVDTSSTLDVAAPLSTSGTLFLANSGAVTRSSQTITAAGVTLTGASSFQSISGDSFAIVSVGGGSQFTNTAPLTLANVTASGDDGAGTSSRFTADAPLTISAGGVFQVSTGGSLDARSSVTGDSSTSQLTVSGTGSVLRVAAAVSGFDAITIDQGALLDLSSGDMAANTLSLGGAAFSRTAGSYHVGTLTLADNATVYYGPSDAITTTVVVGAGSHLELFQGLSLAGGMALIDGGSLSRNSHAITAPALTVSGSSSLGLQAGDSIDDLTLTGGGQVTCTVALLLSSLSIVDPGSLLQLDSFDGANGDLRYALRLYGDKQADLNSYLTGGQILLGSAPQTPGVIYNFSSYGNFTYVGYVAAVPEPSTLILLLGSLAASIPLFRRHAR
jgi:hypothetical protein